MGSAEAFGEEQHCLATRHRGEAVHQGQERVGGGRTPLVALQDVEALLHAAGQDLEPADEVVAAEPALGFARHLRGGDARLGSSVSQPGVGVAYVLALPQPRIGRRAARGEARERPALGLGVVREGLQHAQAAFDREDRDEGRGAQGLAQVQEHRVMGRTPTFRAQAVDHDGEERLRHVLPESGRGRTRGAVAALHELERLDVLTDAVLVDLDLGKREPAEDLALLAADHQVHRHPRRTRAEGGRAFRFPSAGGLGGGERSRQQSDADEVNARTQATQPTHDRPVLLGIGGPLEGALAASKWGAGPLELPGHYGTQVRSLRTAAVA